MSKLIIAYFSYIKVLVFLLSVLVLATQNMSNKTNIKQPISIQTHILNNPDGEVSFIENNVEDTNTACLSIHTIGEGEDMPTEKASEKKGVKRRYDSCSSSSSDGEYKHVEICLYEKLCIERVKKHLESKNQPYTYHSLIKPKNHKAINVCEYCIIHIANDAFINGHKQKSLNKTEIISKIGNIVSDDYSEVFNAIIDEFIDLLCEFFSLNFTVDKENITNFQFTIISKTGEEFFIQDLIKNFIEEKENFLLNKIPSKAIELLRYKTLYFGQLFITCIRILSNYMNKNRYMGAFERPFSYENCYALNSLILMQKKTVNEIFLRYYSFKRRELPYEGVEYIISLTPFNHFLPNVHVKYKDFVEDIIDLYIEHNINTKSMTLSWMVEVFKYLYDNKKDGIYNINDENYNIFTSAIYYLETKYNVGTIVFNYESMAELQRHIESYKPKNQTSGFEVQCQAGYRAREREYLRFNAKNNQNKQNKTYAEYGQDILPTVTDKK